MTRISVTETENDQHRKALLARGVPLGMTPDEIEAWVDANVTDLPSARAALKRLAVDVAAIKRLLWSELRRRR